MLRPLQCRHFRHIWFLLWWGVYGFYVGIGRRRWFRWIRRLGGRWGTSDEGDVAFDNILCLFVEVESIGADEGVDGGSVEEALDHLEEGGSAGEGVEEGAMQLHYVLADVVYHHILINIITYLHLNRVSSDSQY